MYAQWARDRGPSSPASTAFGSPGQLRPHEQHLRQQGHDGDARGHRGPDGRRLDHEGDHQHAASASSHAVERAENQAADAKPDLQGDAGRTELQRGLDERDRQHHAQPHEHRGYRDADAALTRGSLRERGIVEDGQSIGSQNFSVGKTPAPSGR